jgi:hypothetical protein
MTINVYWASIEKEWFRAKEPEPVSSLFYKGDKFNKDDPGLDMVHCPSFNSHLKNVFALRSMYSYEYLLENGSVLSQEYDQDFFDRHVVVKSYDKRLLTFDQSLIFFTDEDSLEVTLCEYPFFEENEVTRRCLIIPGKMDIGKWYRNTNMMFYLKKEFNSFKIKENDIYSYLRFHTEEDINFIEYRYTDTLNKYLFDGINSRLNKKTTYSMKKYYSMFKTKKLILEEIKKNIL